MFMSHNVHYLMFADVIIRGSNLPKILFLTTILNDSYRPILTETGLNCWQRMLYLSCKIFKLYKIIKYPYLQWQSWCGLPRTSLTGHNVYMIYILMICNVVASIALRCSEPQRLLSAALPYQMKVQTMIELCMAMTNLAHALPIFGNKVISQRLPASMHDDACAYLCWMTVDCARYAADVTQKSHMYITCAYDASRWASTKFKQLACSICSNWCKMLTISQESLSQAV